MISRKAQITVAKYISRSASTNIRSTAAHQQHGRSLAMLSTRRLHETVQTAFEALADRFGEESGMYRCCGEAAAAVVGGTDDSGSDGDDWIATNSLMAVAATQQQQFSQQQHTQLTLTPTQCSTHTGAYRANDQRAFTPHVRANAGFV